MLAAPKPPEPPREGPTLSLAEALENPPRWEEVFGRQAPLELEIGCGHGGFAANHCAAHPDLDLVAMEWRFQFAEQTRLRGQKMGLRNLLVLQADAKLVVPRLFGPGSLSVVHIHFPDPWWKRRHFKRRLVDPPFAELLRSRLAVNGLIEVRTDVEDRAVDMRAVLEGAGLINEAGRGNYCPRPEAEVPSSREVRYLQSGEPVYRMRFRAPTGA